LQNCTFNAKILRAVIEEMVLHKFDWLFKICITCT